MAKRFEQKITSNEKKKQAMAEFNSRFSKEDFDLYKQQLSCRTFKYFVDGITVAGYVIKPKVLKNKLPVLVFNRGGNGNFGAVLFGKKVSSLFPIASEGFIVIGSEYRGTYNKKAETLDEFGGADVNDVVALFDYIPSIEGADVNRIGMYGVSRGGMQTHLVSTEVKNVKAIATISAPTDLLMGLSRRPGMERVFRKRIPNYEKIN